MTDREPTGRASVELPTGIVTFLFTDIEGSTALVQELGAQFRDLLDAHHQVLRTALSENGGVEVSTEGDAFFAAFRSPQDAVAAAVAGQRALIARHWPMDAVVRVRMGLHTGEAMLGGDNFVGLEVHRAARVAAGAHGGQILVTDATRALVEPAAAGDLTFRELGAYRLKDLDEPIRLHQVVADGLPSVFPPPRARRLGMLPPARTSFVGRRAALDELRRLLVGTRLLVLTGPGGAGKTRLGQELARTVEDEWRDGVFFVALDAVTDPGLVPSAILQAVGMPASNRPADEVLREVLRDRQSLLVLDNLEQIPDIGATIDQLLQEAPGVKVVATSRVALRVYGEQEYHVPALALPADGERLEPDDLARYDAVALFVDRARAARPAFEVTAANVASIVAICRRLDGLPLAIELAAARVRMLAPEAILPRLDRRLKLLEDRAPNLPPRQRSMRGAIEWSYALLDEGERRLLNRLGVFAGGWDLHAAEAVCDPDGSLGIDVLDGIASLLDKSLVGREDDPVEPRFAMLQTIQEYAREQLTAAGEAEAVARRHADHVRRIVEAAEPEFVGADPAASVARLAPDQENIHAALAWSADADEAEVGLTIGAAAWRLWQLRGQIPEGRRFLERLLSRPSAARPTAVRARALTALGGLMYWQSDPAARERYQEALSIYESLRDEAGIAESLSNLGFSALTASPPDLAAARRYFTDSLRRYEALGDARMVASLTGSLGFTAMALGDLDEARDALERALSLNVAGGYRGRAADNRFALGNLHRRTGRLPESAAMYREALADALAMNDEARKLTYLSAIASWAADAGRFHEAVRLDGAVRRAASQQGGRLSTAPGILDPVARAREAGLDDAEIATEVAAGEDLSIGDAVAFAFALVGGAAPPTPGRDGRRGDARWPRGDDR